MPSGRDWPLSGLPDHPPRMIYYRYRRLPCALRTTVLGFRVPLTAHETLPQRPRAEVYPPFSDREYLYVVLLHYPS